MGPRPKKVSKSPMPRFLQSHDKSPGGVTMGHARSPRSRPIPGFGNLPAPHFSLRGCVGDSLLRAGGRIGSVGILETPAQGNGLGGSPAPGPAKQGELPAGLPERADCGGLSRGNVVSLLHARSVGGDHSESLAAGGRSFQSMSSPNIQPFPNHESLCPFHDHSHGGILLRG